MKKITEISIGGYNFSMEEDAYSRLRNYLDRFEKTMTNKQEAKEVMEDVEARIAEIFQKERKFERQVIGNDMIDIVISHLGEVEDSGDTYTPPNEECYSTFTRGSKHLYRDPDDKKIAGVCSGLAAYFGIDVTLIRIIFLLALFLYGSTFMLYIVLWIVTKEAITIAQKLEMRGIPVTAENIRKFTQARTI